MPILKGLEKVYRKLKKNLPVNTSGTLDGHQSADIAASKRYQYRDINSSDIRCVRIDSSAGHLRGHLSTCDRLNGGFIAISYEWGPSAPSFQQAIWITDEYGVEGFLPMTSNLWNAIRYLPQSLVQDKPFFIDQLCVNQQDKKEKSVQVAGMRDVYKYADQVVCYLGSAGKDDSKAFDLLQRLDEHFREWYEALDSFDLLGVREDVSLQRKVPLFDTFRMSPRDLDLLKPLEAIVYESGWTRRLWMCQEVLLNENLAFLRGSRLIVARSIFLFSLCYKMFMNEHKLVPMFSMSSFHGETIASLYKNIHIDKNYDGILYVLSRVSTRLKCSDPRDKIYAILGLVKDDLGIVPDYEADIADIYTDLTFRQIKESRSLDIFTHIFQQGVNLQEPNISTTRQSWPTWVPTFETDTRVVHLGFTTGSTIPKAEVDLNQCVLNIKGWQIEQIDVVCGPIHIYHVSPYRYLPRKEALWYMKTLVTAREALAARGVLEADNRICHGIMNISEDDLPPDFDADRALQSFITLIQLGLKAPPSLEYGRNAVVLYYDQDPYGSSAHEMFRRSHTGMSTLCVTKTGKVVMTTMAVRPDDIITVFPGGGQVYVLRAIENDEFNLVGSAFAHDYVRGQAIIDPGWVEDLRHLIQTLLTNAARKDDGNSRAFETIQSTPFNLRYYIGGAVQIHLEVHHREPLDVIMSRAAIFLEYTPAEQIRILNRVIMSRPGHNMGHLWRENWWTMIEHWIEAGLLKAPEWMGKLRTFTIR